MELSCSYRPADDDGEGELADSQTIEVANAPPTPPEVQLVPQSGTVETEFACEVVEESTDPEGDDLDYDITWVVNGWANPGSTTESIVAGDLAADEAGSPPEHGDELRCRVRADDGMDTSTPAESEAVVLDNAPPTAGAPLVKPLEPKEGDELTCETSDASDPDGDAIQWTYTWKVNGEPVEGADE